MSSHLAKVLNLILVERFGPIVEKVASYLYQYGPNPLIYIKRSTELPLSKVKESLSILIKYQMVTFVPNVNGNIANYTLKPDRILLMLRYPKYINMMKKKLGDEGEMIIEEILQRGYCTASEVITKVKEQISKSKTNISYTEVKDIFISMVTAKYLIRLPEVEEEGKPVPSLIINVHDLYSIPPFATEATWKTKADNDDFPDKNIFYTVNFDRFHQDMRDKALVKAFINKFDENAGELIELLLQQMYIRTEPWDEVSEPIMILEIKDIVRKWKKSSELVAFFDEYLGVIEQDHCDLIRKSRDARGGSLKIYLKEAFTQFAWEIVEHCVLDKFDTKAARIFRLVKLKPFIDPEQIQKLSMLPSKDAKKLTFQLLEENFLQIQDLKKAAVGGTIQKSFMLFHIKLEDTVQVIMNLCYQTLYNIMTRRNHEKDLNKRIIDKKQNVDFVTLMMSARGATEEQLEELEAMITPAEKEMWERIEKTMKKLGAVELEVDDTLFLLQMYQRYL